MATPPPDLETIICLTTYMQPIMPTTMVCIHPKNLLHPFMQGLMPTTWYFEQLGPHREKQTKTWKKLKTTQAKPKKTRKKLVERMLGFDPKDVFFCLSLVFVVFILGFEMDKTKNNICFCFFEWIWSVKMSKNNKTILTVFWLFNMLGLVFCIEKSQKQKTTSSLFVFFRYLDWSYPFKKFFFKNKN